MLASFPSQIFNPYLLAILTAWLISQTLKVPIDYFSTKKWHWDLFFESGGMPSSHSTLVSCTALLIGLYEGFNTAAFTLALTLAVIVIYDATHVRREAGFHAERLNMLFSEIFDGKVIDQEKLREVLGHTPTQVTVGIILGCSIALFYYLLWQL